MFVMTICVLFVTIALHQQPLQTPPPALSRCCSPLALILLSGLSGVSVRPGPRSVSRGGGGGGTPVSRRRLVLLAAGRDRMEDEYASRFLRAPPCFCHILDFAPAASLKNNHQVNSLSRQAHKSGGHGRRAPVRARLK